MYEGFETIQNMRLNLNPDYRPFPYGLWRDLFHAYGCNTCNTRIQMSIIPMLDADWILTQSLNDQRIISSVCIVL